MNSRVIVESKLNYTNTKGNKKYFTIKHLRARAQTGERREGGTEREREREREREKTNRQNKLVDCSCICYANIIWSIVNSASTCITNPF